MEGFLSFSDIVAETYCGISFHCFRGYFPQPNELPMDIHKNVWRQWIGNYGKHLFNSEILQKILPLITVGIAPKLN